VGVVLQVELSVPGPHPDVGGGVGVGVVGGGVGTGGHDGSLGLVLQSTAGGLLVDDGGG
jgi:hypothetical protein